MATNFLTAPAVPTRVSLPVRLRILAIHLALFAFSGFAAFLLRYDFSIPQELRPFLYWALPVWMIGKMLTFLLLGLDRGTWRYVSIPDVFRVVIGNSVASTVTSIALLMAHPTPFPRSILLLDFILCLHLTAGLRFIARLCGDIASKPERKAALKRIVIYGGGDAGVALLREIRSNPALHYEVKGFIDDDPRKHRMLLQTVPVLGCGADLTAIAQRHKIDEVFIAIPSADGAHMTRIMRYCHDANIRCKTIPGLGEFIDGMGLAKQIRDVAVEDLLGRTPVHLDQTAINEKLRDEVIVVTGAAGSIGSELCRQIARFHPRAIVGYEIAETPLFYLEQEMRQSFPGVPFFPEVGSIQNPKRLAEVFDRYPVSVVYHAAAYKHVPVMENQIFEAIENNVLGTRNVARAAAKARVRDFVMISSDKAVRPTNIMGVTKRVAELLISSLQNGGPKFVSVRFGNVLGSNGSVIPIFKQQIAAGGPVTVTHPEMRRYFMTIPEAAQLVLQASTMSRGGEIFVLDMGMPVKIIDLATNLILLSGLTPGQDIQIEFTGVRPGEKLYEELSTMEEETVPTYHEKVKIFMQEPIGKQEMAKQIEIITSLCEARDSAGLLLKLKELVPEYNPSRQVLETCLLKPQLELAIAAR